ncbi:bifunctional (p)ppGpp synthetase/guanosine-3',5'-bis(diphosphate) 3'-pyrophosphohydrolase [Bermanella marisrubri]|uniref:guanosine-3',5'-bis(diphosphate) 3'-diphosphatase n=1 Tax=Bermanella marisrubri TaxID=207949 RepID=Q1N442_9GAMM|nr:bifunctional (p)ppGpp synthetase/guanosine-3',5'-bis(diphosphate) 3'-pyrophosphohydrolase [Bermanella marisrubri]EAT13023.1 guanosine-3',5'-bis(diphosphate) 3'-pyrophosphohydrolase [Oceanobacter sp. RED65] [Bermanella marisrubri]QIZ82851.1 bifunctional (p)ppGpp synthetase/guanosine-3',5'-bis(diphosphate) 3'-pyrophosphohydrolase [Bermanella marisrubri]
MPTIDALAERLSSYLEPEQINQVCRAYYYAEQAHEGQFRRSGDPYIVHPLAVANILSEMHMDSQSLMAAMLHDVIEDTAVPKDALKDQFGETVSELVDGVSKLTHIKFESQEEKQAGNFQKMAMAMAKDIRVILVKLADRLHNMRTLSAMPPEKKRRIAGETLEIYAPIANRLGISNIRIELEDLCFNAKHPMRSNMIKKAVKSARGNRSELVEKINQALKTRLKEEGLKTRVMGREKHLYSIYRKMKEQKKSFKQIMDVYGFRIIVDNVDSCYRALGIVHNFYKPVPGRFKDYIAIPKSNGYQSLHTTVVGVGGVHIEIQIRTEEMEAMAHNGIAAHWLYKDDNAQSEANGGKRARQWVQGLLELQQRAGNPQEFIESVKVDLFPDDTYVFTPKGRIVEMPKDSTAVDFAYSVHTDVGNTCVGCRIDQQLAPLSTKLISGQTVEIITAPGAKPNPSWLNFVVSSKARSSIRHYLKNQKHDESINLGRRLLSSALAMFKIELDNLDPEHIEHLLREFGLKDFNLLLADIGLGTRSPQNIAQRIAEFALGENNNFSALGKGIFSISGKEGGVVTYARCCSPIPGDDIVGYSSAGRGLVVHTSNCQNLLDMIEQNDKIMPLVWDEHIDEDFSVTLRVWIENGRGLIAQLAAAVTEAEGNLEQISVDDKDAKLSVLSLQIGVTGRKHLADVMRKLKKNNKVSKITRLKNTRKK